MKTKELLQKLTLVKTGLASSGDDEAKSFLFSDGKLYSYSERIFVSVPLDTELDLQVDGKTLFEYVKKIKAEDIELSHEEGGLRIKAGNASTLIRAEEKVKIPTNLVEVDQEHELPEDFAIGIEKSAFSVGEDISKPYLSVAKVKDSYITATNNMNITRYELSNSVKDEFYVPLFALKHIKTIAPTHYSISGAWLVFENTDTEVIFCCRRVDTTGFPDLNGIFSREMNFTELTFPKEVVEVMERVIVFSKTAQKGKQTVRIKSSEGKLSISGKSGTGETSEEMDYEGIDFNFVTNAKVFLNVVKSKPTLAIAGNILKITNDRETHLICLGA
tara:strand:+ start:1187 stop:2179 length:993 start_codon:yes stop_codon:yes gene_type:complete